MKTLFEQMIDGEIPVTKLYEDSDFFVIHDKYPQAPVHLLFILKKRVPSFQDLTPEDLPTVNKIMLKAQAFAKEYHIENSYRFVTNCGKDAGQTIFHLHFHLIGGKRLESEAH